MKKVLKWTGISLSVLLIGLALFGWWMNEPRPRGLPAAEADELAFKMLRAVDKSAWDTTRFLQWSFPGGHDYLWDKSRDLVAVTWERQPRAAAHPERYGKGIHGRPGCVGGGRRPVDPKGVGHLLQRFMVADRTL